ncbi:MAG TPA: RluA family pseudouridine synthase [Candidatus Hydrogenedentes bacterium]|nr:RluA family pseudouridine synthase [Candidatus Hydrogenedentota bacterium]
MNERIENTAGEEHAGLRLDVFLAEVIEDASRSFMKKLIKDGLAKVNQHVCTKPSRALIPGDHVEVEIPPPPPATPEPEDLPLNILYEDAELVIVNKASGVVVHPAPGHYTGTLVNAILHHCPDFQCTGGDLSRPGIVHRLDRDTSGVMVIAKTQRAFTVLAEQAAAHTFDRRYLALVRGEFKEQRGRICASIGRSLADPSRMAVTGVSAREAITNFEVLERFTVASLVALQLETGRTHQIRVHLRFAGRPVLGDPVYGVTDFANWPIPPETRAALESLHGQALHAELLGITHPVTGERLRFSAPPPEDFQHALYALRAIQG